MNKTIVFAAAALALVACASEPSFEQTEEVGPFTVSLLEKNVWHVEDCTSSHPHGLSVKEDGSYSFYSSSDMYIVRGKKKAILIDLSNNVQWAEGADQALRTIFYSRAGKRDKVITVTHNHGDHTGMSYAFVNEPDVTFMLPENDFQKDTIFPQDRILLKDRDCIDLGGETLECVQCEGHTPGSMVFFLKGHNCAFSGDAFGSGTGVWIFDAKGFDNYRASISRLVEYLDSPEAAIDPAIFKFHGGHTYQNSGFNLGVQTIRDAQVLNEQICKGTAKSESAKVGFSSMDITFKYGEAMLVWNKAASEQYVASLAR